MRAPNRLLIVNADDYGLTEGVSRGILRGHRDGIVTSTSVLAVAPAFSTAAWLDDAPELGVGAHLAIVGEDPPLLSAREIPTLVDGRGRFPLSWRKVLPRAALGRIDGADVEREMGAQLEAVAGAVGRPLTHVDTHQHLHLWPSIGAVVARLASRAGIAAVRVTRSMSNSPLARAVNALGSRFAARARAAGLRSPEAFAGFDEGGGLDVDTLADAIWLLGHSAADTAEIGIHPGEADDPDRDRYQWGYRWSEELDALVAPSARAAVAAAGFTLGTFAALAQPWGWGDE